MSEEELFEVVVRAARKGSVPAMRLYLEMLKEKRRPPMADPLGGVDELAARRARDSA